MEEPVSEEAEEETSNAQQNPKEVSIDCNNRLTISRQQVTGIGRYYIQGYKLEGKAYMFIVIMQ
jgi:hypothetical protein